MLKLLLPVYQQNILCKCPLVTAARPVARRGSCDGMALTPGGARRAAIRFRLPLSRQFFPGRSAVTRIINIIMTVTQAVRSLAALGDDTEAWRAARHDYIWRAARHARAGNAEQAIVVPMNQTCLRYGPSGS